MFDTLHLLEGDTSVCGRHRAWPQESYVDSQETRCLFVEAHCQRAGETLLGRRRQMPVGRGSTACLRGTHWLFAGVHCKFAGETLLVCRRHTACNEFVGRLLTLLARQRRRRGSRRHAVVCRGKC